MSELYDAVSGEVTADPELIRAAALEYVFLASEIEQADAEQKARRERLGQLGADLMLVIESGGAVDVGPATVVRAPAPRPAQRVSRSGCERWTEELEALGLGHWDFMPPGIAEVRRNAARILAAGIDLEAIAPTPHPGPDRIAIVLKDQGE